MSAAELPLAIRVAAARASTKPWLRVAATPGRWYPALPALLHEEEDDDTGLYEARLCDPVHGPYDHARGRECAIGFHTRCSGQGCECPHHGDPGREWTGAPEPMNRFAEVYALPRATAARVLAVAQEGLKEQWVEDLESLRSLLSSEYGGVPIPRAFALDVICAMRDNAERQDDTDSFEAWERMADVDWQAADDADRAYVDGGPAEPVAGAGLVVAGHDVDLLSLPARSGDPVVARVEAARSSDLAHVREAATPGRWYPVLVPTLPDERDKTGLLLSAEFQARLTHPTHGPYDHVRGTNCARGEHTRCSVPSCECPHHSEPELQEHELWTGPADVAARFAVRWALPDVTVARVLDLAGEMMWGQLRADDAVDGAPGLADLDALRDTLTDVYESPVTRRFAHSVAEAMLESAVAYENHRDVDAWGPLARTDYEGLDELDRQLARVLGPPPWSESDAGMAADMMRVLRPLLLDYIGHHRSLGRWGRSPWVVASLLLLSVALVPVGVFGWSWQTAAVSGVPALAGLWLSMMNMFGAGERNALKRWRMSIIRAGLPPIVVDDPLPQYLYPYPSQAADDRSDAGARDRV